MLTGRIGLSPAMIGRAGALHRLRSIVDQADEQCSDLPVVVLVVGEAGIGKTRLVREVLDALPSETPADVQLFAAAAEPGSLSRSFDLVAQLAPVGSNQPAADALAAITAVAAPSEGHARTVVVVVEDLHWVDAESAGFLDDLARRHLPRVVIVGTYRPSDLRRGSPGGDLVSRLERRNEVEQIRLERLDRHDVGAMMAAIASTPVSSGAVEAVARRSGGVPFVVEELMRCIGPDSCSGEVFDVQLPWSLEEAVRQQLSELTADERTLIDALAVIAEPTSFAVLQSVAGLGDDRLLGSLRGLMAREVVVEPREDRLWFGHALVADAVLHQLLGRERRRLHERCFETLTRLAPDDHAGLGRHAIGAGRFDEIVDIARRGARQYLDRGASFQALRLACEGLAEDPDQLELLAVATEAAWRLDFQPEALDHARRWRRLADTEPDRIDAQRYIGRLCVETSDDTGAQAIIDELALAAVRYADDDDVASQARAEAAVAQLMMLRHEDTAVAWAERAIEHARQAGDRAIEVQARVEWASALQTRVSREEALHALQEAASDAAEIGDGVLRARAINNMMDLLPPASVEAAALRRELHDAAAAVGLDKLGGVNVCYWDAMAAQAEADLAEYRRLLEIKSSARPAKGKLSHLFDHAYLAIEEGRVADAHILLVELEAAGTVWFGSAPISLRLALAGVEHDTAAAAVAWEQLLALPQLPDSWGAVSVVASAVASALAAGLSPEQVRVFESSPVTAAHPSLERIRTATEGLLLVAEQRYADAIVALHRALDSADHDLVRPVRGLLEIALAQALLAAGDRSGARRAADDACNSLSKWPGWRRDRAEAIAARLDSTAVRSHDTLTAREEEVAALIAEGLTNGQLAARLFISPKTASVHVSNILAKLGLSTRAEIAAWEIRRHMPAVG